VTDRDALIHRIAGAIARKTASAAPAEVLAELSTTHVLVERERWERLKGDYITAIHVACEKELYLRKPGASVCQADLDRWDAHAQKRWAEVIGDLDPIGPDASK
jgi:hypothetical protein